MSYFDPKIYCKQNLKAQDKRELDYWEQAFVNVVANTQDQLELEHDGVPILNEIEKQVIEAFCKKLRVNIGYELQETVVGLIDGYENEVESVDNPETYHYEDGEENE